MPLWKISAKNNWNWGTGKQLVKGMFIEMSTPTTTPPLGQTKNKETISLVHPLYTLHVANLQRILLNFVNNHPQRGVFTFSFCLLFV